MNRNVDCYDKKYLFVLARYYVGLREMYDVCLWTFISVRKVWNEENQSTSLWMSLSKK